MRYIQFNTEYLFIEHDSRILELIIKKLAPYSNTLMLMLHQVVTVQNIMSCERGDTKHKRFSQKPNNLLEISNNH